MMAGAAEEPKADPQQNAIVDAFLSDLKVSATDAADIEVRYTAVDAQTAVRNANRVVERFSETYAAASRPANDAAAAKPKEEMTALERQAKQLSESGTSSQPQSADDETLHAASEAHEAASAEVAAADARLNRARDLVLAGEAHKLLDPAPSALARYLVDSRSNIQRLMSSQKDPGSAHGQQLAIDLAGIDRQIALQVQPIIEKLQESLEVAKPATPSQRKRWDTPKPSKDAHRILLRPWPRCLLRLKASRPKCVPRSKAARP